ncbi:MULTISPECIES: hypothetical protein [unclassified Microbacterium]|uniref:hypothetical protein n=1 Tax=unclassified Microbacterium TaxID=2609290 RepID=UPI00214B64F2|nr:MULTISPECIES: hypothetical protein [unclassified Microbacterium]MCR2783080.1 hypothetical protein [Microbacterium sp. zg.B96]WIM16035.1 hypothetical protein QNO11_16150 [Microbacterium sp. zg-B96]
MTPPATSVPLDVRPLTERVDPGVARARARQLISEGRAPEIAVGRGVQAFLMIMGFVLFCTGLYVASSFVAVLGVLWMVGVSLTTALVSMQAVNYYRFERFAAANGMVWDAAVHDPRMPGMIFAAGSVGVSHNVMRIEHPRRIEVASYRRLTNTAGLRDVKAWGYVAVKLGSPLPHIVLDAVGNESLMSSSLPATFDAQQRVSLEGDFDRYFTLYCPTGYAQDALYLFPPDIMARFIDNAAALDVEIIDDWLFLYSRRELSTLDPATWQWLFSVIDALLGKLAQWERWRDDRLGVPAARTPRAIDAREAPRVIPVLAPPPLGVAATGRRLRRHVPWTAICAMATVGAIGIVWQTGLFDNLGELFR